MRFDPDKLHVPVYRNGIAENWFVEAPLYDGKRFLNPKYYECSFDTYSEAIEYSRTSLQNVIKMVRDHLASGKTFNPVFW